MENRSRVVTGEAADRNDRYLYCTYLLPPHGQSLFFLPTMKYTHRSSPKHSELVDTFLGSHWEPRLAFGATGAWNIYRMWWHKILVPCLIWRVRIGLKLRRIPVGPWWIAIQVWVVPTLVPRTARSEHIVNTRSDPNKRREGITVCYSRMPKRWSIRTASTTFVKSRK